MFYIFYNAKPSLTIDRASEEEERERERERERLEEGRVKQSAHRFLRLRVSLCVRKKHADLTDLPG